MRQRGGARAGVDNAVILAIPSAMAAGLTDPLFWGSLAMAPGICLGRRLPGQPLAAVARSSHALVTTYHAGHH